MLDRYWTWAALAVVLACDPTPPPPVGAYCEALLAPEDTADPGVGTFGACTDYLVWDLACCDGAGCQALFAYYTGGSPPSWHPCGATLAECRVWAARIEDRCDTAPDTGVGVPHGG